MAFGFKLGTSAGREHRLLPTWRSGRGTEVEAGISESHWEPLPPELEDWMGMNPFTGDHAQAG